MTANTLQITPFMHVADSDAAMRFFVDVLGFTCEFRMPGYAYVSRDGAAVRIQGHDDPAEVPAGHGGFAYYIDVRDLAQVEREIAAGLATLPPRDVHGPVDQVYGQRELMIRAPDGNLVVFAQAIQG